MNLYKESELNSLVVVNNNDEINAIIDSEPAALALGTELTITKFEGSGYIKAKVLSGPHKGKVAILQNQDKSYRLT